MASITEMVCKPEDSQGGFSILEIGCGYLPSHLKFLRDDVIHVDIRKDAHHIDMDHFLPEVPVGFLKAEHGGRVLSGVVYEDVDAPKPLRDLIDHIAHLDRVGNVGLERLGIGA